MTKDSRKRLNTVVQNGEKRIQNHLGELLRETVEETLNAMLGAEAEQLCNTARCERIEAQGGSRAGSYGYDRKRHTRRVR